MTSDTTKGAAPRFWKSQIAIAVLLLFALAVGFLCWRLARPGSSRTTVEATLPSTHPIFGAIQQATATDTIEMPNIRGPTNLLPKNPIFLSIGPWFLEWTAGAPSHLKSSGYLYTWDPMDVMKATNVWAFAPCTKSRLADVTTDDLGAVFCAGGEGEKGAASFGTNWVQLSRGRSALFVREGQVVLARLATSPSRSSARTYALEMTRQNRGYLRVRYVEVAR